MQEEELKKEGGKYAHLHEELHLLIEAYGHPADCYRKLSLALWRLHEFFIQVCGCTVLWCGSGRKELIQEMADVVWLLVVASMSCSLQSIISYSISHFNKVHISLIK